MILYKLIMTFFLMILSIQMAFSQCNPTGQTYGEIVYSEKGVDTLINGDSVVAHYINAGQFTNDNIFQIKVPNDTTIVYNGAPVSATIQNIVLDSIENLPSGLSINCDQNTGCVFPGNTNGCIQIYGTVNIADTGMYRLKLQITANVLVFGAIPYAYLIHDSSFYFIARDIVTDVKSKKKLGYTKIYPNPFSQATTIELPSEPHTITIHDILGNKVREEQVNGTTVIEREELTKSIYTFEVRSESQIYSGKLVVE